MTVGAGVAPGTYATTLTATGADGETGSCTLTITVAAFDATPIGAIQGSGYASPLTGQTRSIEGVVTGHDDEIGQSTSGLFPEDRGLYVQDAGDGDDATSDGIFVAEILDPRDDRATSRSAPACASPASCARSSTRRSSTRTAAPPRSTPAGRRPSRRP